LVTRESKLIASGVEFSGSGDATEIEIKVLDLAGPIAGETDLGAGAHREACLCRVADEAGGGRVGAGGDGGNFNRNIDWNFDRVAVFVDTGNGALGDTFDNARGEGETRAGDGA
jgi:hypothetical protein